MSGDPTVVPVWWEDYERLLADVRAIIAAGRGRAAAAVNRELVATYWAVGERIVREEQGGAARAGARAGVRAVLRRAGVATDAAILPGLPDCERTAFGIGLDPLLLQREFLNIALVGCQQSQ